jgi:hypothetical protein
MDAYYGYYFHPKTYHHAPGYPRLDVFIAQHPTEEHFDPEYVELFVQSMDDPGTIECLTVEHPWTLQNQFTVCAGRIKLRDRKDRQVEAFTFGGRLSIHEQPGRIECRIESVAPILDLSGGSPIAVTLAEETEIIFAERRAAWPDDADFDARLVKVAPDVLYAVCLEALRARFAEMPHQGLPQVTQFTSFLRAEISALEDENRWPGRAPGLGEIL